MTEIHKVSVKILSNAPSKLDLDPLLSVFARWRAEASHPAQWVDLADYAHMARGAGIVLIGHLCNFAFDMGPPGPGILYVRKKGLEGAVEERLLTVFHDCFEMAGRLRAEPEFPAGIRLETGRLELAFNDRLETPNTEETHELLRPAVTAALDRLFGSGRYELQRQSDPRKLYGFSIRSAGAPDLPDLIGRLKK
jgi:hypothetical protein